MSPAPGRPGGVRRRVPTLARCASVPLSVGAAIGWGTLAGLSGRDVANGAAIVVLAMLAVVGLWAWTDEDPHE